MKEYDMIREALEALGDRGRSAVMARYMRDRFEFFGVQAPERKAACKEIVAGAKRRGTIDWELLDMCWADPRREMQYFVVDYLKEMRRHLTYDDVAGHLEPYARTRQWWDTIDGLDRIIGGIAFRDSRINDLMLRWSADDDFWIRRIAIDHQLLRKDKTDTELLERIIVNNLGSGEFFINKAIGWSLRDYSKTDPGWVNGFLSRHRSEMHPLSIREASRYL